MNTSVVVYKRPDVSALMYLLRTIKATVVATKASSVARWLKLSNINLGKYLDG